MVLGFVIVALLLLNSHLVVSLFLCSYHRLLVAKYGCKQEKLQEAKCRSAEERRPVHEMERVMGVDLFWGAQDQWADDSPHHLTILHKMFLNAASKGRKEAERYVCQGIWQQVPQLNPEVDISTVRVVSNEDQQGRTPRYLLGGLKAA